MQAETKKMWELHEHSLVDTAGFVGRMYPEGSVGCAWMVFYKEMERPVDFDWEYVDDDYDLDADDENETGNWLKVFASITERDGAYFPIKRTVAIYRSSPGEGGLESWEDEEGPFNDYQEAYQFVATKWTMHMDDFFARNLFKALMDDFS